MAAGLEAHRETMTAAGADASTQSRTVASLKSGGGEWIMHPHWQFNEPFSQQPPQG